MLNTKYEKRCPDCMEVIHYNPNGEEVDNAEHSEDCPKRK